MQVDRGVPFSMGVSLKRQADLAAETEVGRLEATEKSTKKAAEEVITGEVS